MSTRITIAGVGMVPFRQAGYSDSYGVMAEAAVRAALEDARLDYDLVEEAFVGFVNAPANAAQNTLYRIGMTGVPITHVNNGGASGSSALHLARSAVLSGGSECALALGFEEVHADAATGMVPELPDTLALQSQVICETMHFDAHERAQPAVLQLYATQLDWMSRKLHISDQAFARLAVKSRAHAANNPYAAYRDPITTDAILAQPPLLRGLRPAYACRPGCGAAAVIVCTPRFAARHGLPDDVVILAEATVSGTESDHDHPNVLDALGRDATRRAARHAYELAGVGPEDVDVAEVHDSVVSNELIACASVGFCVESDLERFVFEGENTYGGKVVVGPSGGMLARGHPFGATGLAQIVELTWQLRGKAGARQVQRARTGLQHNGGLGGSLTVSILQAC